MVNKIFAGADEHIQFEAGQYICYIDESGGEHASDEVLRRCGWGISVLRKPIGCDEHDCVFIGGFSC